MPDFHFEDQVLAAGAASVCGIDEAGRGPWAGPVVAAAVVLDRADLPPALIGEMDDSKKLSAARREDLRARLAHHAHIGLGLASAEEIDAVNVLQATFRAMARAIADLGEVPDHALVDGNRMPDLPCEATAIVKGDGRSLSIAAASIAAKVERDRIMTALASVYPGYGWERNAGYGTREHRDALRRFGVTPAHRKSFKPIRNILSLVDS